MKNQSVAYHLSLIWVVALFIFCCNANAFDGSNYYLEVDRIASVKAEKVPMLVNGVTIAVIDTATARKLIEIQRKLESVSGVHARLYVNASPFPNAFATVDEGGNLIVFSQGILESFANDDDALAAVMGHEMAHLGKGHLESRIKQAQVLDLIANIFVAFIDVKYNSDINKRQISRLASGWGKTLLSLKFSRNQESEADLTGLEWAKQSGYEYEGAIRLFNVLKKSDNGFSFFNNHPSPADRITKIERLIASNSPTAQPVREASQSTSNAQQLTLSEEERIDTAFAEVIQASGKDSFDNLKSQADKGNVIAQSKIGLLLAEGVGVPKDQKAAIDWFKKTADQGDGFSQTAVGYFYISGTGIKVDNNVGFDYLKKTAEQNYSFAGFLIAGMYFKGDGVSKSLSEASKWYEKSALNGESSLAKLHLGILPLKGNNSNDLMLVKDAADHGSAAAQMIYGWRSVWGRDVNKDGGVGFKYLLMAANQGYESAAYGVGLLYLTGNGVPQDVTTGRKWLHQSGILGSKAASALLRNDGKTADAIYGKEIEADIQEAISDEFYGWMRKLVQERMAASI